MKVHGGSRRFTSPGAALGAARVLEGAGIAREEIDIADGAELSLRIVDRARAKRAAEILAAAPDRAPEDAPSGMPAATSGTLEAEAFPGMPAGDLPATAAADRDAAGRG